MPEAEDRGSSLPSRSDNPEVLCRHEAYLQAAKSLADYRTETLIVSRAARHGRWPLP